MTNPPPRPALTKAADSAIHPARPVIPIPLRSLPADATAGGRDAPRRPVTSDALLGPSPADADADTPGKSKRSGKSGKDAGKGKSAKGKDKAKGKSKARADKVPASISLPPQVLADLQVKAEANGYRADEVVALLVQAWLQG